MNAKLGKLLAECNARHEEMLWQVRETCAPDGVVNLRVATMPDKLNAELTG
jgi:hypothetical protein